MNKIILTFLLIQLSLFAKAQYQTQVSAVHHNVLNGFLSLRIDLCAIGEGKVTFKNFKYTPVK